MPGFILPPVGIWSCPPNQTETMNNPSCGQSEPGQSLSLWPWPGCCPSLGLCPSALKLAGEGRWLTTLNLLLAPTF